MTLNFLHHSDLPLSNPPLKEVICQIRFAPLLEIVQKLPADFQTRIRKDFPNFEIAQNVIPDSNQVLPSEYAFKSANEQSRVSLAINFVALSTKEYSHWPMFQGYISNVLLALGELYGPISMSRIGLRYINELNTGNTKLTSSEELLDIINSDLTSLAQNNAWSLPKRVIHQLLLDDNKNELTIRVAFEKIPKPLLILDFDYFKELEVNQALDVEETIKRLDEFHARCYDAFRWSIKEDRLIIFNPIQ